MKRVTHLVLCLVVFILVGCNTNAPSDEANPLIYGLSLDPSGFDPHIHSSSEMGIVLRQVYDTLIYRDPTTLEFVSGLATDWMIADDGMHYTFQLRRNVTFHDGTVFDAQAVAVTLDRIIQPETASQKSVFMLGPYAGYEIFNSYTIRLKLTQPYHALLDALSQVYLGIASPTALHQHSRQSYQFHQVGTGPYKFVDFIPGRYVILERYANYTWGPDFYQSNESDPPERIEYRFYTDPVTRGFALENNEVQIMGEILPEDALSLRETPDITVHQVAIPGQPLQFLMNTQQYPTDSLLVRQALLLGTDRHAIVRDVFGEFSPVAWGPITSHTLFYDTALEGTYAYDVDQARQQLQRAGYTDSDGDGFYDISAITLTVTILVSPWGAVPQVAQSLKAQWQAIGVEVILQSVPTLPAVLDAVQQGAYNLVALNSFGVDPIFLNQYYVTNASTNWTGYSDPNLDNALIQASQTSDNEARSNLYVTAQRLIMESALVLPIREYVNLNGARSQVVNLQFDAYGWFPIMHNLTVSDN